jgi:hypothetical protein
LPRLEAQPPDSPSDLIAHFTATLFDLNKSTINFAFVSTTVLEFFTVFDIDAQQELARVIPRQLAGAVKISPALFISVSHGASELAKLLAVGQRVYRLSEVRTVADPNRYTLFVRDKREDDRDGAILLHDSQNTFRCVR